MKIRTGSAAPFRGNRSSLSAVARLSNRRSGPDDHAPRAKALHREPGFQVMEVGGSLLGGELDPEAFRSTAWGEQVIIYVGPGDRANQPTPPGVSRGSAPRSAAAAAPSAFSCSVVSASTDSDRSRAGAARIRHGAARGRRTWRSLVRRLVPEVIRPPREWMPPPYGWLNLPARITRDGRAVHA